MWTHSPVSARIGLATPIVQGPFGGGLSSIELVAAVGRAGGLGSFGAHHLRGEQIMQTAQAIRTATAAPFALNLWVPLANAAGAVEHPPLDAAAWQRALQCLAPFFDELQLPLPAKPEPTEVWPAYEEQIESVLAARPAVFSFVFGIPSSTVLERCRSLGITTIGAATTVQEAQAIEAAGVDMVVATGADAGGHRVAFLRPPTENLIGTFSLLPQVRDAVRIPVIAAGGISDGRGIAAALMLGADAVQIGTAFLACEESAAGAPHRQALFDPTRRQTALTMGFSGRLSRGLVNPLMRTLDAHAQDILPYPWQNALTGTLKRAAIMHNRADLMSLWSGQAGGLLKHHTVAELMAALTRDAAALLSRDTRHRSEHARHHDQG
jgi:nitronate monooxygenase